MNINKDIIKNVINVDTSINNNSSLNILFSKNLFDKNNVVAGYLSNAGNVVSNPSFSTSDFIELDGATKITIDNSTGQSENVCFYNSSKTFISYLSTTTNTRMTIDVPSNAKYVRATIGNTNLNIYIIQKGTSIITPTINVYGEDIYKKSQIIYSNSIGSNSQINFNTNLTNGIYRIYYYYQYGNIKSYKSVDFVFEGAINLTLDGSVVPDGNYTILEQRGVYITRDKLVSSRDSIITISSNSITRANNVNINIYIIRIEKID